MCVLEADLAHVQRSAGDDIDTDPGKEDEETADATEGWRAGWIE